MVWYASQIFAEPTPEVRSIFAAHPTLSRGLYLLDHLEGHRWPEGVFAKVEFPHGLPPNGLLVVREVCAPDSIEAEYHGPDALMWDTIIGLSEAKVLRLSHIPLASNGVVYYDNPRAGIHPPTSFLKYLKDVSTKTDTVISFYHYFSAAEMTTIQELAWVFDEQDSVYVQHVPIAYKITQFTATKTSELPRREELADKYGYTVLQRVLRHFGLDLPSRYFAPHTRHFEWEKYKV
ncbi:MAG: hypothetical protein H6671_16435 [Anaerolineaceae bacterium]|nr:hypothetical protein [Anaerolineaceae bacterium]